MGITAAKILIYKYYMTKNTKVILLIVVIVLVVILSIWFSKNNSTKKQSGLTTTSTVVSNEAATSTPSSTPAVSGSVGNKVLSYAALVKKYEGYRLQFSNNCSQVSPNSFVIKKGLSFLIDNREDKEHIFSFSNQKYFVKSYGYIVVTTQAIGQHSILCDGVPRAMVNVEK